MIYEDFRWLAAVIAAHPERKVVGRTRLQKEVMLLQRLGLQTTYRYTMHFHGPYSDGLHSAIGLLESLGMVKEEGHEPQGGNPYYLIRAKIDTTLPDVDRFRPIINLLNDQEAVTLELAATYDAFRTSSDHATALTRLRQKKGAKCSEGREAQALDLLRQLDLTVD